MGFRDVAQRLIEAKTSQTQERLSWIIELEGQPFTQNHHYFTAYREKYLARYRGARKPKLKMDFSTRATYNTKGVLVSSGISRLRSTVESEAISALSELGFDITNAGQLERLRPTDPHEEAFIVIAEVRAYWQVGYKRVIDNVPSAIDRAFLHGLSRDVQQTLVEGLGLTANEANENARNYLAEDPRIISERTELEARLVRMEEVWARLARFTA